MRANRDTRKKLNIEKDKVKLMTIFGKAPRESRLIKGNLSRKSQAQLKMRL